ncbi:hypothetical protein Pla52o_58000 [Novipirellula galeiformis]|uniref:Uncharacterized protein n=1 Tax=Novipirellula galeiformis TaxID=2528004 RepID=A0A5C6BD59_9BACT|nr:hypothetical protein Pla52o_58000 [Novipirellula galeiformis]
MQRSGGGAVSREINVNSRRPLIPNVRRLFNLKCKGYTLDNNDENDLTDAIAILRQELTALGHVELRSQCVQVFGKSSHHGPPVEANMIEAIVRQVESEMARQDDQ